MLAILKALSSGVCWILPGGGRQRVTVPVRLRILHRNGHIDVIPYEWFANRSTKPGVYHEVIDPRGRRRLARCTVTITENQAVLDYSGMCEEYNIENDHYIGETQVTFHDESRNDVSRVEWTLDGEDESCNVDFEMEY